MISMRSFFRALLFCSLILMMVQASSEEEVMEGEEEEEDEVDTSGGQYFSIPAFFVVFREALEASVIISIMLKFLDKIKRPEMKRDVWIGAGLGLVCAILAGVGFIIAFYAVGENFFEGKQEKIFEGILMLFASIVITVLAASMLSVNKFQEMWERKLSAQLAKAESMGSSLRHSTLFWIPFVSILREGLETVIFLAGVGAGYPLKSIPIPGIVGLIVGFLCGYLLYRAGGASSIKTFLTFSTVLLLFISAGLLSHSALEFAEAGMFGPYENSEGEITSVWNQPVWDICDCCSNDANGWSIFRAVFGYTCEPSPNEIFFYLFYWVVALTFIAYKLRSLCFKNIPLKGHNVADDEMEKKASVTMSPESDDAKKAQTGTMSTSKAQIA